MQLQSMFKSKKVCLLNSDHEVYVIMGFIFYIPNNTTSI